MAATVAFDDVSVGLASRTDEAETRKVSAVSVVDGDDDVKERVAIVTSRGGAAAAAAAAAVVGDAAAAGIYVSESVPAVAAAEVAVDGASGWVTNVRRPGAGAPWGRYPDYSHPESRRHCHFGTGATLIELPTSERMTTTMRRRRKMVVVVAEVVVEVAAAGVVVVVKRDRAGS